jgi:hypothetical protein
MHKGTVMNILIRIRGWIIRKLSFYFDSYSLYYRLPPAHKKIKRLSQYALVGRNSTIMGQVVVPVPQNVQIGRNVWLRELQVAPNKYVFIEKEVHDPNGLRCPQHCIKTRKNQYAGRDIEGNLVTLSVDFEGGVALAHASAETWNYYRPFWESKEGARRLAVLFKRYHLPVTWAICGHLFLEECQGDHGFEERDWVGDWFSNDPKTNWHIDPSWYMPDVIRELCEEPLFEIGYHSFGHFRYARCSEDTVVKDIRFCEMLRKNWGINLGSFVFPYNDGGYFDLLCHDGKFKYLRGNIGRKYSATGIIDFGTFCFFNTTQMFAPETMHICLMQADWLGFKPWNYYTHCHQWLEKVDWVQLELWLEKLARLRDDGVISIIKMEEVERYRWHPAESNGIKKNNQTTA